MNIDKVYQSVLGVAEAYRKMLDAFGADQFDLQPPIGGWSYSEVYAHIFDSSLLSLMAINSCINGEGKEKPTAFLVKLVLFFGMFPPKKKYKAPPKIAARVKKISLAAAQQIITDFELQLSSMHSKIESANPAMKVKHPVLGYLNAKQWLRFIEIHLKHHYKQLLRIENSFLQQS